MKRAALIAFLAIFTVLPRLSFAFVTRGDTVYFDGYSSWAYTYKDNAGSDNHLTLNRLWLNSYKDINLPYEVGRSYILMAASLEDKVVKIQESSLNWAVAFGPVNKVTIGRFAPPFAEEWLKDPDQLNLVRYSSIFDQLVYRDDGAQIDLSKKRLRVSFASFLGERSGGVVREQKDGKAHLYSKAVFILPGSIEFSGSYRWSRTRNNLWAASGKWQKSNFRSVSFEVVGFGKDIQWFANYGQKIATHFLVTARYEDLKYQSNRTILGVRFYTRHIDIKTSTVFSDPPVWISSEVLFRF
ncbi:MAG: hypothetical protein AAB394_02005 [Patescibacteria group bacterium]